MPVPFFSPSSSRFFFFFYTINAHPRTLHRHILWPELVVTDHFYPQTSNDRIGIFFFFCSTVNQDTLAFFLLWMLVNSAARAAGRGREIKGRASQTWRLWLLRKKLVGAKKKKKKRSRRRRN